MSTEELEHRSFLDNLPAIADRLGERLSTIFRPYADMGAGLRDVMVSDGNIIRYDTLETEQPGSLCAVDGARITTNMYAGDFMTAVACSANGATGKTLLPGASEGWAHIRLHENGNDALAETAMGALEAHIAHQSQHQVRLLDGSFRTPLIGMQKSLFSTSAAVREEGATILTNPEWEHFEGLQELYTYDPERPVIALPKSNTDKIHVRHYMTTYKRPIIEQDRVFASLVLRPGEMLAPLPIAKHSALRSETPPGSSPEIIEAAQKLAACEHVLGTLSSQKRLYATYFKPEHFSTVIRIEFVTPDDTVSTANFVGGKYASIVNAEMVSLQPGSLEPFAQWNVDQDAKDAIKHMNEFLRDRVIRSLDNEEMAAYGSLIIQNYRS